MAVLTRGRTAHGGGRPDGLGSPATGWSPPGPSRRAGRDSRYRAQETTPLISFGVSSKVTEAVTAPVARSMRWIRLVAVSLT